MTPSVNADLIRNATFSDCRTWRYALYRRWDESLPWCMFVGLNPSTADEVEDDPTIRRCLGFARDWGCGGLIMANAYAYRSTDPKGLWLAEDPIGPDNDDALYLAALAAGHVVVAWGVHAKPERATTVTGLLRQANPAVHCLGRTKAGAPKHPLYLKKTTPLEEW